MYCITVQYYNALQGLWEVERISIIYLNRSTLVWGVKRSGPTEINVVIWPLQVIWVLHHIQTNYTTVCVCMCVLSDHDFIRIWFMLRENKTRGGKLHAVLTTAQIFWTNDVRAVGQPSPHTAPFTFDSFKRSHVQASRWSDKCMDVSLRLICLYQSSQLPKGSPDRASISIPHKPNHGPGGPLLMSSHSSCHTRYQRSDLLPLHAIQRFTLLEYFHPGHFPLWKC